MTNNFHGPPDYLSLKAAGVWKSIGTLRAAASRKSFFVKKCDAIEFVTPSPYNVMITFTSYSLIGTSTLDRGVSGQGLASQCSYFLV